MSELIVTVAEVIRLRSYGIAEPAVFRRNGETIEKYTYKMDDDRRARKGNLLLFFFALCLVFNNTIGHF